MNRSVFRRQGHAVGAPRSQMRGLSLVELMVGVAVGLFVVAAATLLVSGQLADNRRLLLETQLQQDLRATADIVTRELRRTSYWINAEQGVPTPDGGTVNSNPYFLIDRPSSTAVRYNYQRTAGTENFGFRLDGDGVVRSCQSDAGGTGGVCSGAYQELTDPNTVNIREFTISTTRAGTRAKPANDDAMTLPCAALCADGSTACWPRVSVREIVIRITGRSRSDERVERTLNTSVRLRNDLVGLSSEASAGHSCPAP